MSKASAKPSKAVAAKKPAAPASAKKAAPPAKAKPAKAGATAAKTVAKPAKATVKTAAKPAAKAIGKPMAKASAAKPEAKAPVAKPAASKAVAAKASLAPAKAAPAAKAPAAKAAPEKTVAKVAASATKPQNEIGGKTAQAVASKPSPVAKSAAEPKETTKVSSKPERNRMNADELKYFETLLNEKKETLLQELGYLEDNTMRLSSKEGAGDLSSHAYHLADHATETMDREQAFQLASREGKYLYYIEDALDRVRAGTFGVCKSCGKVIPKARLEAVPTAKMCINCKSKQETRVE